MDFLKELNKEQYAAATKFDGPMLILAGAGSGKTKTIIARTANMIAHDINPESILVLTFTNKAAKEMKERGERLLQEIEYKGVMPEFTTFHSWGLRFIRKYISALSTILSRSFSIADEHVQNGIIKDLIKEIFGDQKVFTESEFQSLSTILQNNLISYSSYKETEEEINHLLNNFKKAGKSTKFFEENKITSPDLFRKFIKVYVRYKVELRKNNLVDFDDLINLTIKILKENKDIKQHIRKHYNYIMIDEFQDTNFAQIELLNQILNQNDNICVVGDDSQSIYGWRGADIEYILNFHKNYKEVTKINLVENYRSTPDIVKKSNALIKKSNQKHEFKEALRAFKTESGKILSKVYENQNYEALAVTKYIEKILERGNNPKDIAILYRSNFIVPAFEKELIKAKIPYKIYKGRALLEKKSIQEFLNFFQVFINEKNNVSIEQALISKARYITQAKLLEIKLALKDCDLSLSDVLFENKEINVKFTKPIKEKLDSFVTSTKTIREMIKEERTTRDITEFFEKEFFLIKEYKRIYETSTSSASKDSAEKALSDIYLMISIMNSFATVEEFMETVTIDSVEEEEKDKNKVNLMTVHASKGLEFDYVFLARMNQGIFPSNRSLQMPSLIEEERRLAYVAITRAKKFLHISNIQMGFNGPMTPSQFIREAEID